MEARIVSHIVLGFAAYFKDDMVLQQASD